MGDFLSHDRQGNSGTIDRIPLRRSTRGRLDVALLERDVVPSKAAAEPLADGAPAGAVDDHVVGSVSPPRVVIPRHTAIQDQQGERERQSDPQEPADDPPAVAWRK